MREEYFAVNSSRTVDQASGGIAAKRVLSVIPRMSFMGATNIRPPHFGGWGKDTKTLGHVRLELQAAAKPVVMMRVPRCTMT